MSKQAKTVHALDLAATVMGFTLFLGAINTDTFPPGWGLDARLTIFLCKKILLRNLRK
jgi:hypothetical protein